MRKLLCTFGVLGFGLFLALAPAPALAHEEHCHLKQPDGKLTDAPDIKTKKDCEAKAGTWFHHHQHCHKADSAGKMVDVKGAKDDKSCTAKGGTWTDHGHEQSAPSATPQ